MILIKNEKRKLRPGAGLSLRRDNTIANTQIKTNNPGMRSKFDILKVENQYSIKVKISKNYFNTFTTFRPAAPLTPPPPWTPLPHRYKLSMGVL